MRRIHRAPIRRPSAPPAGSEAWPVPWVQLRSAAFHPFIYKRMVRSAHAAARPGDLVAVFDKSGSRFGSGFWNPHSQIALRMVSFDDRPTDAAFFRGLLESAVRLRRETLRLDEVSNAYRVIHAEGDGLSGLVADRFGDLLCFEVRSLGVFKRLAEWLPVLHALCGTRRHRALIDAQGARLEGFPSAPPVPGEAAGKVRIEEHGVRYEVDLEAGHKTGFFCDQRDNRRRFAELSSGRSVLDVCCYSGGFAIAAKVRGPAAAVTGVDLDESAVAQARRNAKLNQARLEWVHADAFSYMRQMLRNGRQWGAVVLDPPKLIPSRDDAAEGRGKYHDLNRLAASLVEPGGLFVTCSCSGLLPRENHARLVVEAAHRARRRLQILAQTGAAPDHPVMSNCPESGYLKVLWTRVV